MYKVSPYLSSEEITRRLDNMLNNLHTCEYTQYQTNYDRALYYGYTRGRSAQIYALLTHEERLQLYETEYLLYNVWENMLNGRNDY